MNRAIYQVTPCCPKCRSVLLCPQITVEASTAEVEVTCNQVLSSPNEIIRRVCGWKGFAAFWMEDKPATQQDIRTAEFFALKGGS
jgi:hypothetical protein